jgi:hypothetical protein
MVVKNYSTLMNGCKNIFTIEMEVKKNGIVDRGCKTN